MSANNEQIGGTHYRDMDIQPWDAMRAWMSPDQFCGYLLGTAIAYLARVNVDAPGKGGIDDIEKARHVLAKLAETWNFRIFNEFPKEVMQIDPEQIAGRRPVTPPAVSESAAGDDPSSSKFVVQTDELKESVSRLRERHFPSGDERSEQNAIVEQIRSLATRLMAVEDVEEISIPISQGLEIAIGRVVGADTVASIVLAPSPSGRRIVNVGDFSSPSPLPFVAVTNDGIGERIDKVLASADAVIEACDARTWPGPDWSQAPEWADGWVKQKGYESGMWFAGNFRVSNRGDSGDWEFAAPHSGKERWEHAPSFNYPGHWRDSLRQRP